MRPVDVALRFGLLTVVGVASVVPVAAATDHVAVATSAHRVLAHRTVQHERSHASGPQCFNNVCPSNTAPVTYHGGPLVANAQVYFLLFSDSTTSLSPSGFSPEVTASTAPNFASAANATLSGPYAKWWMAEYSQPGAPIGPGRYAGTVTLYDPTLADSSSPTGSEISAAIVGAVQAGQLSASPDAIFVTFLRIGQVIPQSPSAPQFMAYHSDAFYLSASGNVNGVRFAVIPQSFGPGQGYSGGPAQVFDGMTWGMSHEIVETITDPLGSGWFASPQSTGEVGDLCSGASPVNYEGQTYNLQDIYSAAANGCFDTSVTTTVAALVANSSLTLTMDSSVGPVYAQALTLSADKWTATATTDASGEAVVSLPPAVTGPVTIAFAGAGPLAPAATTVSSAPQFTLSSAAANEPLVAGRVSDVTVRTTPATPGTPVALVDASSGSTLASGVTDSSGSATLSYVPLAGPVAVFTVANINGLSTFSPLFTLDAKVPVRIVTSVTPGVVEVTLATPSGALLAGSINVTLPGGYTYQIQDDASTPAWFPIPWNLKGGSLISLGYPGSPTTFATSATVRVPSPKPVTIMTEPKLTHAGQAIFIVRVYPAAAGVLTTIRVAGVTRQRRTDNSGAARFLIRAGGVQRVLVSVVLPNGRTMRAAAAVRAPALTSP